MCDFYTFCFICYGIYSIAYGIYSIAYGIYSIAYGIRSLPYKRMSTGITIPLLGAPPMPANLALLIVLYTMK